MDHDLTVFTEDQYKEYIYGSAEVVGLMSLAIFCGGNAELIAQLVAPARALGSGFQKVNFLRDVQADSFGRGRMYFPGVAFDHFTDSDKLKIQQEIAAEFREAAKAIPALPHKASTAVQLALTYYEALLREIQLVSAAELLTRRVRVADSKKAALAAKVLLQRALR